MELALLFVGALARLTSLTVAQQAGCNSLPSSAQVPNLISANFAGTGETSSSIVIVLQTAPEGFQYRVVCASSSGVRNQYRFVSIVAYYTNNGVGPVYGQFEFECVNSVWSATSTFLENTVFDRTTLTSTSAAVNANNRTDCGYCLNPTFSSPPRSTDAVNHCSSCTGCSQPLCYVTDTTYPTTGNNYSTACCNYYLSDGTCTVACPPSLYPDANRTCVPCLCQNGGTPQTNGTLCSCACPPQFTGLQCESVIPSSSPSAIPSSSPSAIPSSSPSAIPSPSPSVNVAITTHIATTSIQPTRASSVATSMAASSSHGPRASLALKPSSSSSLPQSTSSPRPSVATTTSLPKLTPAPCKESTHHTHPARPAHKRRNRDPSKQKGTRRCSSPRTKSEGSRSPTARHPPPRPRPGRAWDPSI